MPRSLCKTRRLGKGTRFWVELTENVDDADCARGLNAGGGKRQV
jgi:hypothetical protein